MKRLALPATLAAALALQACVSAVPPMAGIDRSAMPRCAARPNPHDCYVQVSVTETPSGCQASIAPDQDSIRFSRQHGARMIYWALDAPSGYTFTADGVAVPNNNGQFDLFKISQDERTYRVRNKVSAAGTYKYVVNVVNQAVAGGGAQCRPLDPFIHND